MIRQFAVGGALLGAALLAGSALAEGTVKSGPQEGKSATPMPFNPLHANGPDAGKKVCLV